MEKIRSRAWCYTLYDMSIKEQVRQIDCEYHIQGYEKCPTTGREHYQSFIYFENDKSFSKMKKLIPDTHIQPRSKNSTNKQASDYCRYDDYPKNTIENTEIWEIGILPQQGKRTDIEEIKDVVKTTNSMRKVIEVATNLQQIKMAEYLLKYSEKSRDYQPTVLWYYGTTGTGKSKAAHAKFEGTDYYRKTELSGKWWEGYDGQENIIIDDITETTIPYKQLLDITDRYATRVECKNGSRQFMGRTIIITTIKSPQEMYYEFPNGGDELLRRITTITEFKKIVVKKKDIKK